MTRLLLAILLKTLLLQNLSWSTEGEKSNIEELRLKNLTDILVESGPCRKHPGEILLENGQFSDFQTNNFPNRYSIFEMCSWIFTAPLGSQLTMDCESVSLFWFADLYLVDGDNTIRHNCWYCTSHAFMYEFVSNSVEIGLKNYFFFTSKGFNCRIYASGKSSKDDCKCGESNSQDNRIVGGTETEVNEFPWVAGLVFTAIDMHFCGGCLITDQFVLTAAHCTGDTKAAAISVHLGAHRIGNPASNARLKRPVLQIIIHPDHDTTTNDYDFSLLRIAVVDISSPVHPLIRPLCLPSRNRDYSGKMATVAGWGTTTEDGDTSDVLLSVKVPVITNDQCDDSYDMITHNMICAGKPNQDSCQGDSGGGLWTAAGTGAAPFNEVIGIVSFGYGCGKEGYPGVYARVTSVLPWIRKETSQSTTCSPPS